MPTSKRSFDELRAMGREILTSGNILVTQREGRLWLRPTRIYREPGDELIGFKLVIAGEKGVLHQFEKLYPSAEECMDDADHIAKGVGIKYVQAG